MNIQNSNDQPHQQQPNIEPEKSKIHIEDASKPDAPAETSTEKDM